jgi:mRNA interferase MazF
MTGCEFGDVILVPFPFTEQSASKKRPAVVISSAAYHRALPRAATQQIEAVESLPNTRSQFGSHMIAKLLACTAGRFVWKTMTTLEVKFELPDRLAREAQAAGLLEPNALRELLLGAIQRRAGQALLAGAARATQAGSKPLSMAEIQIEVNAARRERKVRRK